jgi:tryptophan synthase alpha chain
MGYANPMIARGAEWFAAQCAEAGVDGIICVDIPSEEDAEIGPALRDMASLHPPRHAHHRSARLPAVLEGSSGFLYYVSVAGITGKQQAAVDQIEEAVERIKAGTDLPVAVGFGVRTPEQAADLPNMPKALSSARRWSIWWAWRECRGPVRIDRRLGRRGS